MTSKLSSQVAHQLSSGSELCEADSCQISVRAALRALGPFSAPLESILNRTSSELGPATVPPPPPTPQTHGRSARYKLSTLAAAEAPTAGLHPPTTWPQRAASACRCPGGLRALARAPPTKPAPKITAPARQEAASGLAAGRRCWGALWWSLWWGNGGWVRMGPVLGWAAVCGGGRLLPLRRGSADSTPPTVPPAAVGGVPTRGRSEGGVAPPAGLRAVGCYRWDARTCVPVNKKFTGSNYRRGVCANGHPRRAARARGILARPVV